MKHTHKRNTDLILSDYLYNFIKSTLEKNDFSQFKKIIDDFSLSSLLNPREIQMSISNNLDHQIKSPYFLSDQKENEKINREIKCFNFLLNYTALKNFSIIPILTLINQNYQNYLIEYLNRLLSPNIIKELSSKYGLEPINIIENINFSLTNCQKINEDEVSGINILLKQLNYSVKTYFTFYRVGALILFLGKEKNINPAIYLKELWDHTNPEDANRFIQNKTPVQFDLLWITYIQLFGGRNDELWSNSAFELGLGYNDYHGSENYLYQYYILMITRCIQSNNSTIFPDIDNINLTNTNQQYYLKEIFLFVNLFINESCKFNDHCDFLIENSDNWEILFKNKSKEALKGTKKWINDTISKFNEQLIKIKAKMDVDPQKIEYFSKLVLDEYGKNSLLNELTDVKPYTYDSNNPLEFNSIALNIPNLKKEWFFKENFSHPNHFFSSYSNEIVNREIQHVYKTLNIEPNIQEILINNFLPHNIYHLIKSESIKLKENGLNPSIIFMPSSWIKRFVEEKIGGSFSLNLEENLSLNIIKSIPKYEYENIIILDKSAGLWMYKPILNNNRLCVEITKNEADELSMKILIKTTINYSILHPNRAIRLKFDYNIFK
ncbi:hypothetical protein [Methanospirillum lacunae]|uniref:Uncharacterized protein n=1 Tax=Methanospirillum lacunae TaxID=668570 RepID=A0A2V2NCR3_9EURY|nr:hypothetical protein [Methanospirillum lacunae]PWR74198.1 hypothetical protein DK846_03350 [Methanospirillum lacunae]